MQMPLKREALRAVLIGSSWHELELGHCHFLLQFKVCLYSPRAAGRRLIFLVKRMVERITPSTLAQLRTAAEICLFEFGYTI